MDHETLGPLLIVLAAFGGMAFAVRYRREEAVRRFGADVIDAMAREAEAKTKQVAVRWVAGVVAALGLSLCGAQVARLTMSPTTTHTVFGDLTDEGGGGGGGFVQPDFYTGWEGGVDPSENGVAFVGSTGGGGRTQTNFTNLGAAYFHIQDASVDSFYARRNHDCPGDVTNCTEGDLRFWLSDTDTLYDEVWVEWNVWYPWNFTHVDTLDAGGRSNNKRFFIWGDTTESYTEGGWGSAWTACPSSTASDTCTSLGFGTGHSSANGPDAANLLETINAGNYILGQTTGGNGRPATGDISYPNGGRDPWITPSDTSTWVNFKAHVKVSSSLADSSAQIQVCKNDVLRVSMPAGTASWFQTGNNGFNALLLHGASNSQYPFQTTFAYDSISVWRDNNVPTHWPAACQGG